MTASPFSRNASLDDGRADALLVGLVERASPSRGEGQAVAYLVEQMGALGFQSSIDAAGNAVGVRGAGERTLLLLGHIDTVPGAIDVRREGDLLYGRGTVDAKGPLAAFVVAAALAARREDLRVVVAGAVEEEAATSKGARHLLHTLHPDAVVIGEPSGWRHLTVGYKGRLLVNYKLSREIGHTAGPDAGICEQAVEFWQQVLAHAEAFNAERTRMFDQLTPSLRRIHSESDGLIETVSMTLGFRLPLGLDIDGLEGDLAAMARDAQVRFRGREVAYRASKSNPLVRAFLKAFQRVGVRPSFKVKSGTSDMNVVGPVWRCPILAYGPGDSNLDHTPHEHIDLREYHRAIGVLTDAIAGFR